MLALAGGVGGARLAVGLAEVVSPRSLAFVVNTADDFEHLGLAISPDLDTVMYTLAHLNNPRTGWGRADETWNFMSALKQLGGEDWFQLGDRDLGVHVLRTAALRDGGRLSDITRSLAARLGIRHAVFPMTDSSVRTRVNTHLGEMPFQDYFVRYACRPRVSGFRFSGSHSARPPRGLWEIMRSGEVRALIICPSNPYVSIAPILSVPAIGQWLRRRNFPVIAVSPIVGGAAIKGPAAKMMREMKHAPTALGVVEHYGDLVDGWVIDEADGALRAAIEKEGKAVKVTDTVMSTRRKSARLARVVEAFARSLGKEVRHAAPRVHARRGPRTR